MAGRTFYSISDAARTLGKETNRKLLRALIRQRRITTYRVGRATIIDQEGLDQLRAAVQEWDNRPRLTPVV